MSSTPNIEAVIDATAVYSPGQCARCGSLTDVTECGMLISSTIPTVCRDCHPILHDELGILLMARAIQAGDPDGLFADYVVDSLIGGGPGNRAVAITPAAMAKHIFTCAMFFLSKYFADPTAMEKPLASYFAAPSAARVEWPASGPVH